jgi:O-antigen biosynthesis protein
VSVTNDQILPLVPHGKFFSRRGEKFFFKALRFEGCGSSNDFNHKVLLRSRLDDLHTAHTTAVVIAESQAESSLDVIRQAGLYALVEIEVPFEEMLSRTGFRSAVSRISERVSALRTYPAITGYLLDCPVDAETVRFLGLERLRKRLSRLLAAIRKTDSRRLAGLKHQPYTAGLALQTEDFIYATLPPLALNDFCTTVIRLHNLAEARPLLLELSQALPDQDQLIACAFGLGVAGVVARPVAVRSTSKPGRSSLSIRMFDRGELLPFLALNGTCPPKPARTPMVSVVICAYNAERTMRQCLESLRRLDYPNLEVIVVDDGSRDSTAEIAADFPEFRLIRQPNKGLSTARNVGLHAALGEIIAYTDSDCVADPHWLTLMVRSMVDGNLDGCGGPNYAPHEDGWVEGCVAASPGAPCHVLIGDDRAEHLAGCNMICRKAALIEIGGFDPQFTAAGDDVDICWRLLDAGYTLGYSPAAFVWHFRRNTLKAYYGQQRGYGKAEALLYFKYPERFNMLGQIRWNGTIPGLARSFPGGKKIRVGWTRDPRRFQCVYERPLSMAKVAPLTAEWTVAAVMALLATLLLKMTVLPAMAALFAGPLWAFYYSFNASLEKCHEGFMSRLLIAWLSYTGPLSRAAARYRARLGAGKRGVFDAPARQRPTIDWKRGGFRLTYWNDAYTTRDTVLDHISTAFAALGRPVLPDAGWKDIDLSVKPDWWTRIEIKTADEELGGMNLRTNVAARVKLSLASRAATAGCAVGAAAAGAFGAPLTAAVAGLAAVGVALCALCQLIESGRFAYRVVEQCAIGLNLVPLGKPVLASDGKSAPVTVDADNAAEAQPAGR